MRVLRWIVGMTLILMTLLAPQAALAAIYQWDDGRSELFVVGLVESQAYKAVEPVEPGDDYPDSVTVDGRVAMYLTGKIKGKYLVTAALDTDRPWFETYQNVRPDQFYPVYGDFSSYARPLEPHGKLYVLIQKDKDYFLYGNYASDVKGGSLITFNRRLRGAKAYLERPNYTVTALTALTRQIPTSDELPVPPFCQNGVWTNGLSTGPYYVSHIPVVEGSQRVYLVLRDQDDASRVISEEEKVEGVDYVFDPDAGRLEFIADLRPTDLFGNPYSVVIRYDYLPTEIGAALNSLSAIRGTAMLPKGVRVGATHISDATGFAKTNSLAVSGMDVTYNSPKLGVTAEAARSVAETSQGSTPAGAYKVKGASQLSPWFKVQGDYSLVDKGFKTFQSIGDDRQEYGLGFDARMGERVALAGNLRSSRNNVEERPGVRTMDSVTRDLLVTCGKPDSWRVGLGYNVDDSGEYDGARSDGFVRADRTATSKRILASLPLHGLGLVESTLAWTERRDNTGLQPATETFSQEYRLPLLNKGTSKASLVHNRKAEEESGSGETLDSRQDTGLEWITSLMQNKLQLTGKGTVGSASNHDAASEMNTTTLSTGANYKLNAKTSTGLKYARTVEDLAGDQGGTERQTLLATLSRVLPNNGSLSLEAGQEVRRTQLGSNSETNVTANRYGIKANAPINDRLSVFADYLVSRPVDAPPGRDFMERKGKLRLTYLPTDFLETGAQWEGTVNAGKATEKAYLSVTGYSAGGLTAYVGGWFGHTDELISSDLIQRLIGSEVGVTYRPIEQDRLNAIAYYQTEKVTDFWEDVSTVARTSLISSEAIYDFTPKTAGSAKLAYRCEDGLDSSNYRLAVGRVTHRLGERLDVGAEWRALTDLSTDVSKPGAAVELGFTPMDCARLAVGYNFHDYEELRLDANRSRPKGPYFTVGVTF